MSLLPAVISKLISSAKTQRASLQERFEQISSNSKSTVEKYREAIKTLKNIPLHPNLKKPDAQNLADLYYSNEKLEKWRKTCETLQSSIDRKINNISSGLKTIKDQIVQKNGNVKAFIKQFVSFENESDGAFKEFTSTFEKSLTEFITLYHDFRKKLEKSFENIKESFLLLNNQEQYSKKVQEFQDKVVPKLQSQLSICIKHLVKASDHFRINLERISENKSVVQSLIDSIGKLSKDMEITKSQDLEKLERDFSLLLRPSLFPAAYFSLLSEISRRRRYFKILREIVEILSDFISEDNNHRRDFLAKYGHVISEPIANIIPSLKEQLNCRLIVNFEEFNKLPQIDLSPASAESPDFREEFFNSSQGVTDPGRPSALMGKSETSPAKMLTNELKRAKEDENIIGIIEQLIKKDGPNSRPAEQDLKRIYNEREVLTAIEIENLKKELNTYKSIFSGSHKAASAQTYDQLKQSLMADEQSFQKTLQDLLLSNAKFVLSSVKGLLPMTSSSQTHIKKAEIEPCNHLTETHLLKEELSAKELLNTELANEIQNNLETIEGLRMNLRTAELNVEALQMKVEEIEQLRQKVQKVKEAVTSLKSAHRKLLEDILNEKQSLFQKVKQDTLSTILDPLKIKKEMSKLEMDLLEEELTCTRARLRESEQIALELTTRVDELQNQLSSKVNDFAILKTEAELFEESSQSRLDHDYARIAKASDIGKSIDDLYIFVPFDNGIYVPFAFNEDLFKEGDSDIPILKTENINSILAIDQLSGPNKKLLSENSFILIARIDWLASTEKELEYKSKTRKVTELVVSEVKAILSIDNSKFAWFNLNL